MHPIRHWERDRDPLARELREVPEARAKERGPPLLYLEREAHDLPSRRLTYSEPRYPAQDVVPLNLGLRELPLDSSPQAHNRARLYAQDMRVFHPRGKDRPALKINGVPAEVITNPKGESKDTVVFKQAGLVIPCIKRKTRREVMFALRKSGRGYKVPHRRNWMSEVPC